MADFEEFFAREYDALLRSLTLAFGNGHTAEDAVQEGFAEAHVRWAKVGAMERPAAWVYVVALRHERRRIRRYARILKPLRRSADVDEALDVTNRVTVIGLLNTLTSRQRRVVVLRYHADLTLDQIADALGCSVGTVKATLNQALKRLRVTTEKDFTDANI